MCPKNYVPAEFLELIERFVRWNEEVGDWQLKCIAYTGNNMRACNPPQQPLYKPSNAQMLNLFSSYQNEMTHISSNDIRPPKLRMKSSKRFVIFFFLSFIYFFVSHQLSVLFYHWTFLNI
ncbi:unnamed protein product [Onchocerca flexuosa]|uniref:Uncharacterized protein n=1 Tax=Onchocerca flexuosa TaxID=387005 RepID=A0A183HTS3_9BILA|nr:unnamed protein product [Onchocerca flexuosa]